MPLLAPDCRSKAFTSLYVQMHYLARSALSMTRFWLLLDSSGLLENVWSPCAKMLPRKSDHKWTLIMQGLNALQDGFRFNHSRHLWGLSETPMSTLFEHKSVLERIQGPPDQLFTLGQINSIKLCHLLSLWQISPCIVHTLIVLYTSICWIKFVINKNIYNWCKSSLSYQLWLLLLGIFFLYIYFWNVLLFLWVKSFYSRLLPLGD